MPLDIKDIENLSIWELSSLQIDLNKLKNKLTNDCPIQWEIDRVQKMIRDRFYEIISKKWLV